MNGYDGIFTGPYMKALQVRAFVEDMQAKREMRQREREQWAQEMRQQKRRELMEDMTTRLFLDQSGARPVGPNDAKIEAGLDAAIGPIAPANKRTQMPTPYGDMYMPTQGDRDQKMIERAKATGTALGHQQLATEEITNPYETVDLGGPFGPTQVRRQDVANVKIKAWEKLNPDLEKDRMGPDKDGYYTTIWRDKQGREVRRERDLAGKPMTTSATAAADKGMPATAMRALRDAQTTIDKISNPEDIRDIETKKRAALGAVETAVAAYPNDLEGGIGEGGWPYIKPKPRPATPGVQTFAPPTQPSASSTGAAGGAKPYTGRRVTKANARKIAAGKGMTELEWTRRFTEGGGVVTR